MVAGFQRPGQVRAGSRPDHQKGVGGELGDESSE